MVEQTVVLLHQFRRRVIHWERRLDLREALVSLVGVFLTCWRPLKHTTRLEYEQGQEQSGTLLISLTDEA
ncbi:hypothetical protein ACH4YO_33855 [Streptomyces noursei]|uniref:hypothetical protein n=1 Tax=Streptomyces noursei TaxID=1971 RepID=UPI003790592B